MINLELYRIFYVVAETKNITKASEILNISQPAVTKHIKNLEDQLGNPLFIRTKKGVILNEYGEKIFLKVKQALNLITESEKEISEYKSLDKGTIKIGISTTLARRYLIKRIKNFHEKYPNVVINIYTDPTKDLIKQLKNGTIDLIISKFPQNKDLDLDYICCESGKNSRIIPISQTTKKYIVKYIDKSRPEFVKDNYKEKALFVNSNGERFSRQGLWKLIKKYANIANIDKNINPTMLRHSFAIHLLNEGANIVVVSKILGNSNLSSLQSYLDYVNKNIRQELKEKHPRK